MIEKFGPIGRAVSCREPFPLVVRRGRTSSRERPCRLIRSLPGLRDGELDAGPLDQVPRRGVDAIVGDYCVHSVERTNNQTRSAAKLGGIDKEHEFLRLIDQRSLALNDQRVRPHDPERADALRTKEHALSAKASLHIN